MTRHCDMQTVDGIPVVRPHGELDLARCPEMENTLKQAASAGDCLILDLLDVRYLESEAVAAFVRINREMSSRGGGVAFVCKDKNVLHIFEIAGLLGVLHVFEQPERAVEYVRRRCGTSSVGS